MPGLSGERNYFVHSRWVRTNQPGTHVGIRSLRSSPREGGAATSEAFHCTPDDAIEVAESSRMIAKGIERFIEGTFPEYKKAWLMRRSTTKRMKEFLGPLLSGWETPATATSEPTHRRNP